MAEEYESQTLRNKIRNYTPGLLSYVFLTGTGIDGAYMYLTRGQYKNALLCGGLTVASGIAAGLFYNRIRSNLNELEQLSIEGERASTRLN